MQPWVAYLTSATLFVSVMFSPKPRKKWCSDKLSVSCRSSSSLHLKKATPNLNSTWNGNNMGLSYEDTQIY